MKPQYRIIIMLVALAPLIYLAIVWNSLPAKVPMHFDWSGKVDRLGSRSELWISTGIICLISMGLYALMTNIHRIDPKRTGRGASPVFHKLALGMVVFLAAINLVLIRISQTGVLELTHTIFPLIGLLLAFLGNYMPALKPNYFAGIRLPWTLSDDDNWRRTHHLAGRIWFWGGLLFVVVSIFLPMKANVIFLPVLIMVMVLIPAFQSYRIFRDKKRESAG